MKHILNDLTEQEKNAIREQHTGGMKVMTEKFSKLTNSKLGDVKLISEQPLPYKASALATSMSKPIVGMLPQIKACVAQGGYPKLTEFLKKQENKQLDNIVIDMLMTFSVKKDSQASDEIRRLIDCLQKSTGATSGTTVQEQSLSDLGKKVKSYGQNLVGKLPDYWPKLKNMNPKPTVSTSNLLQKALGGAAEVLQWMNGENALGVHSDGKVEIIIGAGTPGSNGLSGKQQKQVDFVGSILKSFGMTPNWKQMHEGQRYAEIKGLNPNQISTLVNNSSKFLK